MKINRTYLSYLIVARVSKRAIMYSLSAESGAAWPCQRKAFGRSLHVSSNTLPTVKAGMFGMRCVNYPKVL